MTQQDLPFSLEGDLEERIACHPDWLSGIEFGQPRPGHPEGRVRFHIASVLGNVDRFYRDSPLRPRLRLIALIHDTFKFKVDRDRPRCGENHHGMIARRFAETILTDESVLEVIETHDDAFNAWQCGNRDGRWDKANHRAAKLIDRLSGTMDLYLAFYRCDNTTDGKEQHCFEWFDDLVKRSGEGSPPVRSADDRWP